MKIYRYTVLSEQYDTENKLDNFFRVYSSTDVEERNATYKNIGDKKFLPYFGDFIFKEHIGKVFKKSIRSKVTYSVFLLEDDKVKAMSLLKEAAKKDLDELYKQVERQQLILATICSPVNEIEEI